MWDGASVELLKVRYMRPLEGVFDELGGKLVIGISFTLINSVTDIFQTPLELIAVLMLAMIGDFIFGILASMKKNIPIRSLGLRQFGVKLLEYTLIVMVATGISKAFGESDLDNWIGMLFAFLKHSEYLVVFLLVLTEFKSMAENLRGEPLKVFFDKIDKKIREE